MNYDPCADLPYSPFDLINIFRGGNGCTEGEPQVLRKGIKLFTHVVSDLIEECMFIARVQKVAIWDYFEDSENEWKYSKEIEELWVQFLIEEASEFRAE